MCLTKFYTKVIDCNEGTFYDKDYFDEIINEDFDAYYTDENQNKKILFKFRKNIINTELADIATKVFKSHSKGAHNNRGFASGTFHDGRVRTVVNKTSRAKNSASNISGYFDKPYQQIQSYFKTKTVCRTTQFTRDNKLLFDSSIAFFQSINDNYKLLAPYDYIRQNNYIQDIRPSMRINNTVFTTITSNYNWRTAAHKDIGDFEDGLGNLTITGDELWDGCYLGFPEYKVAINVRKGDFLLMDVHQLHCNTEININNGTRLSFVCYLRKNMVLCNTKKIIKGETFYYHKK